jgi:hypothetical protein
LTDALIIAQECVEGVSNALLDIGGARPATTTEESTGTESIASSTVVDARSVETGHSPGRYDGPDPDHPRSS